MRRLAPLFLALPLLACGDDDDAEGSFPTAVAEQAISNYKQLVNNNYADVLTTAGALKVAIAAFVAAPSEATQKAAKDAWIAARLPYGPSEAFRFYDGPIDNPEDGPEGLINSWPLDENFIDYTRDVPTGGIVNDSSVIDASTLTSLNAARGEAEISTGYHAIEFLLWGQDDETPGQGAGKRSFTDYTTAQNFERRKQYLTVVTDLLLADLQKVADQWKPSTGAFALEFGVTALETGAKPQQEAISDLLKSIGSMAKAELSGERMTVAYSHKDQEDEHSCFSDNTSVDLLGNGLGIQNVWLGRYGALDGVGVQDVVSAVDPVLATKTTTDLEAAVAKLQALAELQRAGTPFDVIVSAADGDANRKTMLDAITALKAVAGDVEQAASKLGLTITLEDPSETL